MHAKVACVGGAIVDWVATTSSTRFPLQDEAYRFARRLGGVAVNIARCLKLAGCHVGLFSCIGQDESGQFLREQLTQEEIPSFLAAVDLPTAYTLQVYGENGKLLWITEDTPIFDDADRLETFVRQHDLSAYPLWVVDSDLSQACSEALVRQASSGTRVFGTVTTKHKVTRLPEDLTPFEGIFMNLDELQGVANRSLSSEADIVQAAQLLFARGCAHLFVTQGAQGAWGLTSSESVWEAAPVLQGISLKTTLGAGDAFTAGVVGGWLGASHFSEALKQGVNMAHGHLEKVNAC